jgi:Lrp/AsnC family leucine-responsive transcriptional regulator
MVNNYKFTFFLAKYAIIGDMLDVNDLDRTDLRLLAELQKDASLSNLELADKVGLSPTPCARRVKRLVTEGFIERQVAILNPEKLGYDLTAHVSISMDRHTPDRFDNFETEIATYAEVIDCSVVTGQSADYLLRVVVKDMKHFEAVLLGKLTRIPGVTGVHSSFVLRKVISRTEIPLG